MDEDFLFKMGKGKLLFEGPFQLCWEFTTTGSLKQDIGMLKQLPTSKYIESASYRIFDWHLQRRKSLSGVKKLYLLFRKIEAECLSHPMDSDGYTNGLICKVYDDFEIIPGTYKRFIKQQHDKLDYKGCSPRIYQILDRFENRSVYFSKKLQQLLESRAEPYGGTLQFSISKQGVVKTGEDDQEAITININKSGWMQRAFKAYWSATEIRGELKNHRITITDPLRLVARK